MTELSTNPRSFWQQPIIWFSLVGDLLIIDQLSKYAVRNWLEAPITLLPKWLELRFVENTGVAFSLPVPGGISSLLAAVVSLYLGHQLLTRDLSLTMRVVYILIMAGALGNLIDRLWQGAVTDFISVASFPVFNTADSFIFMGVVLMLWHEVMSG